ncbi:hypothetical protein G7Y89_g2661 [Cudoniella acicularis]|uniref:Uncharacterized protein n=1 Tax=Cudoniella acicularis TaxID=354080 RepID=A0A8H4RSX1_9HELO|nr:hypothetical protein G7Y89_g2661 [Cudoniella acicularis]
MDDQFYTEGRIGYHSQWNAIRRYAQEHPRFKSTPSSQEPISDVEFIIARDFALEHLAAAPLYSAFSQPERLCLAEQNVVRNYWGEAALANFPGVPFTLDARCSSEPPFSTPFPGDVTSQAPKISSPIPPAPLGDFSAMEMDDSPDDERNPSIPDIYSLLAKDDRADQPRFTVHDIQKVKAFAEQRRLQEAMDKRGPNVTPFDVLAEFGITVRGYHTSNFHLPSNGHYKSHSPPATQPLNIPSKRKFDFSMQGEEEKEIKRLRGTHWF